MKTQPARSTCLRHFLPAGTILHHCLLRNLLRIRTCNGCAKSLCLDNLLLNLLEHLIMASKWITQWSKLWRICSNIQSLRAIEDEASGLGGGGSSSSFGTVYLERCETGTKMLDHKYTRVTSNVKRYLSMLGVKNGLPMRAGERWWQSQVSHVLASMTISFTGSYWTWHEHQESFANGTIVAVFSTKRAGSACRWIPTSPFEMQADEQLFEQPSLKTAKHLLHCTPLWRQSARGASANALCSCTNHMHQPQRLKRILRSLAIYKENLTNFATWIERFISGLQSSKVILGFLVPCGSKPHGCSTISPSFQEMTWSAMFVFYRRSSTVQQTIRPKKSKPRCIFWLHACHCISSYLQHCLLDLICTNLQDMLMKGDIILCRTFQRCPETWLVGITSVWIFRCSIASTKSKREVPSAQYGIMWSREYMRILRGI